MTMWVDKRHSEDGSSVEDGDGGRDPNAVWLSCSSTEDEDKNSGCSSNACLVGSLCILTVIAVSCGIWSYGVTDLLKAFLRMLPKDPGWGWYGGLYVVISLSIVCVLPFWPPLCMCCGLIFGLGWGFLLNLSSIFTAAVLSILIGSVLFKDTIRTWIEEGSYETVRRMMLIIEDGDDSMQFLILFRFLWIPMFLRNYAPSTLEVPLWKLVVACIPHAVWIAFLFSSIGASFKNTAELLRDKGKFNWDVVRWQDIALFVVALTFSIILAVYTHRMYTLRLEEEQGLFYEKQFKAKKKGNKRK